MKTFISYPGASYQVPVDNSREEALRGFHPLNSLAFYGQRAFLVLNKYAPGRARYEVLILEHDAAGILVRQNSFIEVLEAL